MAVSPRSVALQGIGFAVLSVALQGWFAASQPAWVPTPDPDAQSALVQIAAVATDRSMVTEASELELCAVAATLGPEASATCVEHSAAALVACVEAAGSVADLSAVATLPGPVAAGSQQAPGAVSSVALTVGATVTETTAWGQS